MIIHAVKFKSGLSDADVKRVFVERMPRFKELPKLIQKYYGFEPATGEFTGIYCWESKEALEEFRQSELAKSIPEAYQAQGEPRIEMFEVVHLLRS